MYENAPQVALGLLEPSPGDNTAAYATDSIGASIVKNPSLGIASYKVLTECPLVIMLLFQTYHFKYMQKNAPLLLPSMLYLLSLDIPLCLPAISAAGTSSSQKLHDLFAAQVTLTCVTYFITSCVFFHHVFSVDFLHRSQRCPL